MSPDQYRIERERRGEIRPDGRTVERWANHTDSGQNRLPPSPDRWRKRSRTYPGIAAAMAEQWAPVILSSVNLISK